MDTSVASGVLGERVHNIGLMNDRQNTFIFAGVLAIIGAVFFGFGSKSNQTPEDDQESLYTEVSENFTKHAPYLIGIFVFIIFVAFSYFKQ